MRSVIERFGHSIDSAGFIHYDDRTSNYERAEKLAGKRLDRRRNYAVIEGAVCELAEWTQECSGCDGGGCAECGHQGRVRHGQWFPVNG